MGELNRYRELVDRHFESPEAKRLALIVLLHELAGETLEREMAVSDETGSVYAYLVPPVVRQKERLSPQRREELMHRGRIASRP
jgi:hypothetical protein